jgi:hypothetical protein
LNPIKLEIFLYWLGYFSSFFKANVALSRPVPKRFEAYFLYKKAESQNNKGVIIKVICGLFLILSFG